ncbi:lysophospholipid acyltransferase family protein [Runella aurantiaca]|uniref:Glycerol acyltransferase n=1 Tax=Runella aurantiaca TaxID=2282308 RepID=A0A369IDF2_9BACT|nr:lysophospholipid acyltransferase family protein [Runella aurantiaca]RDB05523.1 glycerol acyltransferase [Runella aurantiaca]
MLFYSLLKFVFTVTLRLFFRRFQVHGLEKLRKAKGPLILAVNHPNTFMDPLIVATLMPQRVAFIANGGIFNRLTRPVFKYFHVIPVYRKKDTSDVPLSPAELNKMTFQRCYDYLKAKGTILIFPEGTSEIERRLRELKTGTARIALGAEYENNFQLGLQILPIGLNYSDPTRFRSDVFINVGNPIALAGFKEKYNSESFETVEELTDLIQQRMAETVIITEDEEEDTLVKQVEILYKNQLFEELVLDSKAQKDEFDLIKQIVTAVRYFEQHRPALFKSMQVKMSNYLDTLHKLRLSDEIFTQTQHLSRHLRSTVSLLILGLPVYLFGLFFNYLPYILPSKITPLISKDISYRAPLMMTLGIFTFPLFYGLQLWIFQAIFQLPWLTIGLAICLPLSGFFVLWYWGRVTRLSHVWHAIRLFRRKPTLMQTLSSERTAIFQSLNEAKELYLKLGE